MPYKQLRGVPTALDAAEDRKVKEQEAVAKQMKAGEPANLPPPPEHSAQAKTQKVKKKKKKFDQPGMQAPPPLDGEILDPPRIEPIETERRYSSTAVGLPLVFPTETSARVFRLARYGMKPEVICKHIDNPMTGDPIDIGLLTNYFTEELKGGARVGAEETAKAIHDQVTGENGVKRSPQAAVFRARQDDFVGFKDTTEIVHVTKEAEELRKRIEQLDEHDILQLRAILAKRIDAGNASSKTPRVPRRSSSDEDDRKGDE